MTATQLLNIATKVIAEIEAVPGLEDEMRSDMYFTEMLHKGIDETEAYYVFQQVMEARDVVERVME